MKLKLIPAFQPVVNVLQSPAAQARYPIGEVLARWSDGDQIVGPYQLPTEADWIKTDLDVVKQIRDNLDACALFFESLSINVSEATLDNDAAFKRWLEIVCSITRQRKIRLILEITEQVSDRVLKKRWREIATVRAALAVDDYGDANSTIDRLESCSWDFCKFNAKYLARSQGLDALKLCSKLGINTIVEQVEKHTYSMVGARLGINLQQGYYHSRPLLLSQHATELREITQSPALTKGK